MPVLEEDQIRALLRNLNSLKCVGADGMLPRVMRELGDADCHLWEVMKISTVTSEESQMSHLS